MLQALDNALVERFALLFRGNTRSYGQFDPSLSGKRVLTIRANYTLEHVLAHLEGEMGLGLVPILDDGNCWWAAIDIDVHGPAGTPNVDILAIGQKVARLELPLIVCRSKSGGVHCYVFFKSPQSAGTVRLLLTRWSTLLGFPGAEIFPKQVALEPRSGETERPLGNWINLPYFSIQDTNRYCVDGGKQVSFDYFLSLAEGRACTLEQYEREAQQEFATGPPCLQKMFEQRVDEGGRNTAVYQAAVFLKRAFADDWRQRVDTFNKLALTTPLTARETRVIIGSVTKREYQYKCREEPCRSLCNRELCKTRPHGIKPEDERANDVPLIDNVEQVIATPIRWALTLQGKKIELTTDQLFNFGSVRQAVAEKLLILLPPLKKFEWDQYLRDILGRTIVTEEMTAESLMGERVREFCRRVRMDRNEDEDVRRTAILRGMPALISLETEWYYGFKMLDFIEYLKRRKSLNIPDYQVHSIVRRAFGPDIKRRDKLYIAGKYVPSIWTIPVESVEEQQVPTIQHKAEF